MFAIAFRDQNYHGTIRKVEIPFSDNTQIENQKKDLGERVFSAALTVIVTLGFVLAAVSAGKFEEALFLGIMGLVIVSSYVNPSFKSTSSIFGRVIEKRRYYLPMPSTNHYAGRAYIEYPEFKLWPYSHPIKGF